ncbi:MAG: peptidylprolyl isomerase [Coriobacteriaceae bacterium]
MALYTPEYQPTGEEIAVINTSKGTIRVQLAGNDAPSTSATSWSWRRRALRRPEIPRYAPGFVIQGGCPNTREATPSRLPVAPRLAPLRHRQPGLLHQGGVHHQPEQPHEDGASPWPAPWIPTPPARSSTCAWAPAQPDSGYTVFGQTIEGKDVIGQLRAGDVIESVVIENAAEYVPPRERGRRPPSEPSHLTAAPPKRPPRMSSEGSL